MFFVELSSSAGSLSFATHPKARRGRGVLFATAPFTLYLLGLSVLFLLALQETTTLELLKQFAFWGAAVSVALTGAAFAVGRNIREQVDATATEIRILRHGAFGPAATKTHPVAALEALAIDPSLRSLGADVLFVAVYRDGRRVPIAEGEPHSGQLRQFAARIAQLTGLPLQAPKFTQ